MWNNKFQKMHSKIFQTWNLSVNFYLCSVDYAFLKGEFTWKKISLIAKNLPEPTSKRMIQISFLFFFFVIVLFISSCQNLPVVKNKKQITYLSSQTQPLPSAVDVEKNQYPQHFEKKEEQLFIRRNNLKIQSIESGSASGSMWAEASQPRVLLTDYMPSKIGDFITVNIPDELQFKDLPIQNQPPELTEKFDVIKSFKFEIVGIEPGGNVFLRGFKNSEQTRFANEKKLMVFAKLPFRELTSNHIDASMLTEVSLNEVSDGAVTDYSSSGWDLVISRHLAGFVPDKNAPLLAIDEERKELLVQKNAIKDQQKALKDSTERLLKDRKRFQQETAKAAALASGAVSADLNANSNLKSMPPQSDGGSTPTGVSP